jgi:hypothetical protein
MALINIKQEILPLKKYEHYGIEVLKDKEKMTLNNIQKEIYIDLGSLSWSIGIKMNQLLDVISYSPITSEYMAFYREEQKIIRVIYIRGAENLIRNLMSAGHDPEVLKTIRNQINKTIEQMERSN